MKFFANTAEASELCTFATLGLLNGVTTTPSLIAKSGRKHRGVIAEIRSVTPGPVSAEVITTDAAGMITKGKVLATNAPNVVVKIGSLDRRWPDSLPRLCRDGHQGQCRAVILAGAGGCRGLGRGDVYLSLRGSSG